MGQPRWLQGDTGAGSKGNALQPMFLSLRPHTAAAKASSARLHGFRLALCFQRRPIRLHQDICINRHRNCCLGTAAVLTKLSRDGGQRTSDAKGGAGISCE
ncbi:unnamed protein product [Phaeothamnion confervicola]